MSIINDALKKTQQYLKAKEAIPSSKKNKEDPFNRIDRKESPSPTILTQNSFQAQTNTLTSDHLSSKYPNWILILSLIILCFSLYGIFVMLLKNILIQRNLSAKKLLPSVSLPQSPITVQQPETATVQQPEITQTPLTQSIDAPQPQEKDTELHLSGIMTMNDKQVALIDGEIYEEGETIQGMQVHKITLDQVEIMNANGEITALTLKKKP